MFYIGVVIILIFIVQFSGLFLPVVSPYLGFGHQLSLSVTSLFVGIQICLAHQRKAISNELTLSQTFSKLLLLLYMFITFFLFWGGYWEAF